MAEKCDVLILTEGIQINMDGIQEPEEPEKPKDPENKKQMKKYEKKMKDLTDYREDVDRAKANNDLFKKILKDYKIVSLNHFNSKNKYEETTNVILKKDLLVTLSLLIGDIDPDTLKNKVSKEDNININNSSIVTITYTEQKIKIINIHGPSNGILTPRLLRNIYDTVKGDNIKYICGDGNMDDYYSLEGRSYIQEDFEKAFDENIELKVANFMIIKKRPFAMPFINTQFWKGSDPEKYDVQFALTIKDGVRSIVIEEDNSQLSQELSETGNDDTFEDLYSSSSNMEPGGDDFKPNDNSEFSLDSNKGFDIGGEFEIGGGSRKKTKKKYKLNKISNKNNRYKNSLKNKLSMKNKKHRTKKRRKRVL